MTIRWLCFEARALMRAAPLCSALCPCRIAGTGYALGRLELRAVDRRSNLLRNLGLQAQMLCRWRNVLDWRGSNDNWAKTAEFQTGDFGPGAKN